jgi:hypothetical protein
MMELLILSKMNLRKKCLALIKKNGIHVLKIIQKMNVLIMYNIMLCKLMTQQELILKILKLKNQLKIFLKKNGKNVQDKTYKNNVSKKLKRD